MNLTKLFSPDLTSYCKVSITNKKKALEKICQLVSAHDPGIKFKTILDGLLAREKMGHTALSHQIGLPHTRVKDLTDPLCVVLLLKAPINFAATEKKPVDLIFGLIVPEDYIEEHLQLLSKLTKKLQHPKIQKKLRQCTDNLQLYQRLLDIYEHS